MIIVNTDHIEGMRVAKTLGLVYGNSVKTKWFVKDIMASVRKVVGGEMKGYTQMMSDAREEAIRRMVQQAKEMGGNAVINTRFTTSTVTQEAAEVLAYGTAVVVE